MNGTSLERKWNGQQNLNKAAMSKHITKHFQVHPVQAVTIQAMTDVCQVSVSKL